MTKSGPEKLNQSPKSTNPNRTTPQKSQNILYGKQAKQLGNQDVMSYSSHRKKEMELENQQQQKIKALSDRYCTNPK